MSSPSSRTPPDPLSDVLSHLRPHTYVAGGFDLGGDWSIQFDAHSGIKCYAVVSGACLLKIEGSAESVQLAAGDCVLLPNGRRFVLARSPALDPVPLHDLPMSGWLGGVATLNGGGETLILGGHFAYTGAHTDLLLGAMPPVVRLRESDDRAGLLWALERMRQELTEARPGGALVAQHLAHLVLVQALRLYLANQVERPVGWLFALADPQLSAALGAVHADPGARWTLAVLAETAGMSRSAFAERFKRVTGASPVAYVTRWRMLVASDRLTSGTESVAAISASVGYESESAFSTAFRRVVGCSPRQYGRSP